MSRTPYYYDGTRTTTSSLSQLLPKVLDQVQTLHQDRPDLILASWPDVVGKQIAPMTTAASFQEGVLVVHVKNSTLFYLLSKVERPRLLKEMQKRFPHTTIKNLLFRMG